MISSASLASSKRKRSSLGKSEQESSGSGSPESPSRIPVKSSPGIGGMTFAYSPLNTSSAKSNQIGIESHAQKNENISTSQITTHPEDYSRKLQELRTAMELLKTPPKKTVQTETVQSSSPLNRSWSLEHLAEKPADSSMLRMNSFVAEDVEEDQYESTLEEEEIKSILSRIDSAESMTSPVSAGRIQHAISTASSPYISAEELKARLEATRDAFQRSLAQSSNQSVTLPSSPISEESVQLLASLDRRSQLRHVPVSFEELEAEVERKFEELDRSLSPANLRRTSSQVDSIRAELEEIRAAEEQSKTDNFVIFVVSAVLMVAAIALGAVLTVHWHNLKENYLSLELILMKAEAALNYLLQD